MGMKTWTFDLEGVPHKVELDYNGKKLWVDGQPSKISRDFIDTGNDYPFQLNGHTGAVHVRSNGLTNNFDLSIDGRSLKTGQPVQAIAPLPAWGWLFIVVCVAIPIVALGGAIPAALGIGGAFGCASVARNADWSVEKRALICAGISGLCWGLFVVLMVLAALAQGA